MGAGVQEEARSLLFLGQTCAFSRGHVQPRRVGFWNEDGAGWGALWSIR